MIDTFLQIFYNILLFFMVLGINFRPIFRTYFARFEKIALKMLHFLHRNKKY